MESFVAAVVVDVKEIARGRIFLLAQKFAERTVVKSSLSEATFRRKKSLTKRLGKQRVTRC